MKHFLLVFFLIGSVFLGWYLINPTGQPEPTVSISFSGTDLQNAGTQTNTDFDITRQLLDSDIKGTPPKPLPDHLKKELNAVKAKVAEAAAFLVEHQEQGLKLINDRSSYWAQDPYIFVIDLQGVTKANPNNTTLNGISIIGLKDIKGNDFLIDFIKTATDKEKMNRGWCAYWWNRVNDPKPLQKFSYIMLVPGTNWFVGGGIYKEYITLQDIVAATED